MEIYGFSAATAEVDINELRSRAKGDMELK
jgi:hypothetical protein